MYKDTREFLHQWGKRVVRQSEEGVKVLHLLKCASVKSTIWCSSSFNYLTRLQICHSGMVQRCHPYTFRNLHIQHLESGWWSNAQTGKLVNWNVSRFRSNWISLLSHGD